MSRAMIEHQLSRLPYDFLATRISTEVHAEAKKRVLDSLACFYGAYNEKPVRLLRDSLLESVSGEVVLWGSRRRVPAEVAAWANGAGVRALDYNDTYLSREPCHPSDLITSLWAACELSDSNSQGRLLLNALVLGYEVLCRLCDAKSLRLRGWDHVTYLPIASAVACSYILGLKPDQTRHAVALAAVGNNALRQTRVGTISDWKAACAAYAARSGLWAARLAGNGFTGPHDIFSGKHGFFNQVSGPFQISRKPLGEPWKIMSTHTKFFPAEHHAQSAIEAAIQVRRGECGVRNIREIVIDTFRVAVDIIGSEKEKWFPSTRETADHSMPYLVAVALLDGDVTLAQYKKKRFLDADVKSLVRRVRVKHFSPYSEAYPREMPTRVSVRLKNGKMISSEVRRPKGYAGRPMSGVEVEAKFQRLAAPLLGEHRCTRLVDSVLHLDRIKNLNALSVLMEVKKP